MKRTPAYDPIDPQYWDEHDLRSEIEKVFQPRVECRLCNKFCGSFPKLFDAIDNYCTEEQYATVDATKFKSEDVKMVVALCFQRKLCEINCPYTPGNHDWAMKKENFEASLKWGGKAFRGVNEAEADVVCSDCPLAALPIQQGTGRKPLNPVEILVRSYRGEPLT